MLFFWFISALFVTPIALEGIGITVYQFPFLLFYVTLPVFLYLYLLHAKTNLRVPLRVVAVIVLFLILSCLSAFVFSLDKQRSIEQFMFFLSLVLVFLFGYSRKIFVTRLLTYTIPALGLFFILYSLISPHAVFEKQVVFPTYGSHNHLGDFLGLALVVLLSVKLKGWRVLPLILLSVVFFIFIILSYSRSAYVALFIVALLFLVKKYRSLSRRALYVVFFVLTILLLGLSLASTQRFEKTSPLYPLQAVTIDKLGLLPRDILAGRNIFFSQAINSIYKYPFFGIGGGNFIKTATANYVYSNFTDSAHNILLEMAVEQGIPATLVFVLVCIMLFYASWKKSNVWGFALIYLMINFQTDYTYQILLFPVIGSLLAAIVYDEHTTRTIRVWLFGLASVILFFVVFCIMRSVFLTRTGKPTEAIRWYPFNKEAYIEAIKQENRPDTSRLLIQKARAISPDDPGIMLAGAQKEYQLGFVHDALNTYDAMYKNNSLLNLEIIQRIYMLKKQYVSTKDADTFLHEVALNYRRLIPVTESFMRKFGRFCYQQRGRVCEETGWVYPKL